MASRVAANLRGINLRLGTLASGTPASQFSLNLPSLSNPLINVSPPSLKRQASVASVPFRRGIGKDRTTDVASVSPITARRPVVPSSGTLSKTTRENITNIGKRLKRNFFGSSASENLEIDSKLLLRPYTQTS